MKRHRGSRSRGFTPTMTMRDSSSCREATEITVGSKWPKETRHFCASGRSWLSSSSKTSEKSLTCDTTNLSVFGGVYTGAHSSDNLSTVCFIEEKISECQQLSQYFMRNRQFIELNICC